MHQDRRMQYLMQEEAKRMHQDSRMQYFQYFLSLIFHCFCHRHIILSTKINFDMISKALDTKKRFLILPGSEHAYFDEVLQFAFENKSKHIEQQN